LHWIPVIMPQPVRVIEQFALIRKPMKKGATQGARL
jgi:hypothetical protein